MTDRFKSLLISLNEALSKVNGSGYQSLFVENEELRKEFYSYFGLSGATFVVADNRKKRFVLLQDGIEDAESYEIKLRLPVMELPNDAVVAQQWPDVSEYNRFTNRIFQIQRGQEGLGGYQNRLVLSREPEFLAGLKNGQTVDAHKEQDWCFCSSAELFVGLVSWRWLLWIIYNWGPEERFGERDFSVYFRRAERAIISESDMYFDKSFFDNCKEFYRRQLPEVAISELDNSEAWQILSQQAFQQWQNLRRELDGSRSSLGSFEKEFSQLRDIYPLLSNQDGQDPQLKKIIENLADPNTAVRAIHDWIQEQVIPPAQDSELPNVMDVLEWLHDKILAPLPGYFYFTMQDKRAKEHLVVPVLRSETYPIVYYVGGQRKTHTAVVIALASLNDLSENEPDKSIRILQLKTLLRMCADRIIDSIFIQSLVDAERAAAKEKAARTLRATSPDGLHRVFLLGSYDTKVSFLSQQSRALMLVRALEEQPGMLEQCKGTAEQSIGIVGGGVAGVTAAAALALLGYRVVLYEANPKILWLQENAEHRFIHPHISSWPDVGSLDNDAGLPILNWQAGHAKNVIKTIREEFERIERQVDGLIKIRKNVTVEGIKTFNDSVRIIARYPADCDKHALVIVTLGFGLEKRLGEAGITPSYWQPDALHKKNLQKRTFLIAGTGDGGLIDLARAAIGSRIEPGSELSDFRHEEVIRFLTNNGEAAELGQRFQEIDRIARAKEALGCQVDLYTLYTQSFEALPDMKREQLIRAMEWLKREDTDVTLNYTDWPFFRLDTALINRLLAFLLIYSRTVSTTRGKLIGIKMGPQGKKLVEIEGSSEPLVFDEVLTRFGPDPEYVERQIPDLKGTRQALGGRIASLGIASELDQDTIKWYLTKLTPIVESTLDIIVSQDLAEPLLTSS